MSENPWGKFLREPTLKVEELSKTKSFRPLKSKKKAITKNTTMSVSEQTRKVPRRKRGIDLQLNKRVHCPFQSESLISKNNFELSLAAIQLLIDRQATPELKIIIEEENWPDQSKLLAASFFDKDELTTQINPLLLRIARSNTPTEQIPSKKTKLSPKILKCK